MRASALGLLAVASLFIPPAHAFAEAPTPGGVAFQCSAPARTILYGQMQRLFHDLRIAPTLVRVQETPGVEGAEGMTTFSLATESGDTDTLTFPNRPEFWVYDDVVTLPAPDGQSRETGVVSRKEILLSMLQRGRLTKYAGKACTIDALREEIGLRQNIAAWAGDLKWGWPDGTPATWNTRYWSKGTPVSPTVLRSALLDAMLNQGRYAIGCYTAAKMVYAHAIVDYYARVSPNLERLEEVKTRLWSDGDPLVGIEPPVMWNFEKGHDPSRDMLPGKLLRLEHGVAARHFIPGDWAYFVNPDPETRSKLGYEGSNSIYLGRNRFSDYYNDNEHFYTFEQKLDEVYQWQHGVFSRSRDHVKAELLSPTRLQELAQPPGNGGLLLDLRAVPYRFGFED